MVAVEVGRNSARKVLYNVRGVVGRDVFSVLHYSKAHYNIVCFRIEIYGPVPECLMAPIANRLIRRLKSYSDLQNVLPNQQIV